MKNENHIFAALESDVHNASLSDQDKAKIFRNIQELKSTKLNLLITGATGVGKSSTINALFNSNVSTVGTTPNPETMDIRRYELGNLVIWDSPGLGDGRDSDNRHARDIVTKLNELDEHGELLIDLVLVLLDAASRDLGTSYELINNVIIPNLGKDKTRIIVALNQADQAMKGRNWNFERNEPEPTLVAFLEEKVASTKRRIFENTQVEIDPIYFSAGYKDVAETQNPFNLSKLLYFIVKHTPREKRIVYVDNISTDKSAWESNDTLMDYNKEVKKTLMESVIAGATRGADIGGNLGASFGKTGEVVGRAAGAVLGGVVAFFSGFFS
jgi:predicted GTPase